MYLGFARWGPAAGIVFAVLAVLAKVLQRNAPEESASEVEIATYYANSDHLDSEKVAFFLVAFAAFFFLVFLGSLRGALARAEGEPGRLTAAAVLSGAVFITLIVAEHVLATGLTMGEWIYGEDFQVDPNIARLMRAVSFGFFVVGLFAAAAMIASASLLAFHSRVLPNWLANFGIVAAVAGLLGVLVWPAVLVLGWIAAASLVLLFPRAASSASPQPSASTGEPLVPP